MIANTCFQNRSEFGYTSRVLKSGICKYYRRGETEKFTWCVMEMARFNDIAIEKPAAKAIVTNLVNRLKILLMEEISCCEISRIYNAICILNEYDVNREKTDLLLKFCDIVCDCKRNRITSYMNTWWKHQTLTIEPKPVVKCMKYKRSGDTDDLLQMGETLIEFIETKDERMFGVMMKLFGWEGKFGKRYRRTDASYLAWEIMENSIEDELVKEIWKFGLDRYMKKSMKERYYFGIWIGLMVWKSDCLNYECIDYSSYPEYDAEDYYKKMTFMEMDEYVVNDFHVNQSFGLEEFALNGAYVKDEDLSLLGDKACEYKRFYIESKRKMDEEKKEGKKVVKKVVKKKEDLERIDWSEFTLRKIIEEGVCGGKVPCILVKYKGKRYILKEMKKSMNFGKDYLVVDRCKSVFGLRDMNMKRIRSNRSLVKRDKSKVSYVNNCEIGDRECIYCMMEYWDNLGDIGKHKNFLEDEMIAYECLKIRLFDGLFRSSDNILRNILVNKDGDLLSIDEGDLYGKRKHIMNRTDWCRKHIHSDLVTICLEELLWNIEEKKERVCEIMDLVGLDYKQNFCERIDSYREIVWNEWLDL